MELSGVRNFHAHRSVRELDRVADFDHIAGAQAAVHLGDLVLGVGMREDLGPRRCDHLLVATGVVAVLVGVEDLGDGPALRLGRSQAFLMVKGIDRQGLAGFSACNQVIEIATGVCGPDLLDDHCLPPLCWRARV